MVDDEPNWLTNVAMIEENIFKTGFEDGLNDLNEESKTLPVDNSIRGAGYVNNTVLSN